MIVTKKTVIIGSLTLLFIVIVAIVSLFIFRKPEESSVSISNKQITRHQAVITNFDQYSDKLSSGQEQDITTNLYQMVNKKQYVEAHIRKGSYNVEKDGAYTVVSLLVDIPSLKQTYRVRSYVDGPTEYRVSLVLCPEQSDLIYGSFKCQDIYDQ